MKNFAILVLLLLLAVCATLYWSYSDVVFSVPVSENVVALTYDDGPNPPDTDALLELLERKGVKATFFLKGRNVEAYPEHVRRIHAAGHEIGNHSFYHRPMFSLDKAAMQEEVTRTTAAIESTIGETPRLFRPPYMAQGPGLTRALSDLNMLSVGALIHGSDWEVFDPQLISSAVLENLQPGALIVLHDGHADVDDPGAQESRAGSVAATEIIIDELHERGYRIVTAGELLDMDGAQ